MKPYEIERYVRQKLGEMYGTRFKRAKLPIGQKSDGGSQIHEFDLISEDNCIVGEAKSGKCSRMNYNSALVDCLNLSKTRARVKLMIFTDKELYDYFKSNSKCLVSPEIQLILISVVERALTLLG